MNETEVADPAVFEANVTAVILYDDFACAAKAKEMFDSAVQRAGEVIRWSVKPWRLDMLTLPLVADAALKDAADAHLVLLSLRHPVLCPAWVVDWLEQWAKRRQVQEAALAIWEGGNSDTLSMTAAPKLAEFSGRHGLSFIFRDAVRDQDDFAALDPVRADARGWLPGPPGLVVPEPASQSVVMNEA